MPNWCENNLEISGNKEDIAKFHKQASKDVENLLNQFVPMPEELKEVTVGNPDNQSKADKQRLTKLHGACNWHDWSVNNWGTKWDASNFGLNPPKERLLVYWFDTAWAPPMIWLQTVSRQFPNLRFKLRYKEEGMGFKGTCKAFNGECEDVER